MKEIVRVDFTRQQATAGIAGQDDTENFEQVTEATRGVVAQGLQFNYQMGLGHDAETKAPADMPGAIGPYYTEQGQRNFYSYWAELMGFNAARRPARAKVRNGKVAHNAKVAAAKRSGSGATKKANGGRTSGNSSWVACVEGTAGCQSTFLTRARRREEPLRKRGSTVSYDVQREIERFLFREARLLDEGHYDEWLALFADDVRYWVPTRETTSSFETSVAGDHDLALFDDDKDFLRARIQRLHSGLAHAETPPSRTRRFISNIEIDQQADDEYDVGCNMLIYQTRLERTEIVFVGRREDRLRKSNGSWQIARRKIVLDQTLIPRTISIFL